MEDRDIDEQVEAASIQALAAMRAEGTGADPADYTLVVGNGTFSFLPPPGLVAQNFPLTGFGDMIFPGDIIERTLVSRDAHNTQRGIYLCMMPGNMVTCAEAQPFGSGACSATFCIAGNNPEDGAWTTEFKLLHRSGDPALAWSPSYAGPSFSDWVTRRLAAAGMELCELV